MTLSLALLVLAASTAPTVTIVAKVDDALVTAEEVKARVARTTAAGGTADAQAIVEDLVNEALLAREGYALSLEKGPRVVEAAEAKRRSVAAERLVATELKKLSTVDEKQLRALYHETGDSAELLAIVVATPEEAKALLARLQKGADFATEAKASLDPRAAANGGALGTASRGQLEPALHEAAFLGELDKPQGPVKLSLGFAVVVVKARAVAPEAGFDAKREQIRRFAEEQLGRQVRQHFVTQLRAKYAVRLDEPFLDSTGTSLSPSPEQAARVVAKVKALPVTYGEVVRQVVATFGGRQGGHLSGPSVKKELAWSRVDELLLEVAALDAGLDAAPEVKAQVRAVEREAVIRAMAERARTEAAPPTRAEVEAYFKAHAKEYQTPGTRACGHLVVKTQEHAQQLALRAQKGEAFEELAREYSIDTATGKKGGELGDLSDAQLENLSKSEAALGATLKQAAPGKVAGPVASRSGWHLVRCGAPKPPVDASFAAVEKAVTERLVAQRGLETLVAHVGKLRANAKLSVDAVAVAALASGN